MTTSTAGPGRHLVHDAFHALHIGLVLRVLYTTALVLLFACAIGVVVGLAMTKVVDLVVGALS